MAVTPAPPPNPVIIFSMSNSLLEGVLNYRKCPHWTDKEGNIQCTSTEDKIGGNLLSAFSIDGDQKEFLMCQSTVKVGSVVAKMAKSQWPKALLACNECNINRLHGHGFLCTNEGDYEGHIVYVSVLHVKSGITEPFLKTYIQIHYDNAIDFFTRIHNDWKLY
jgi:hypothetical protein